MTITTRQYQRPYGETWFEVKERGKVVGQVELLTGERITYQAHPVGALTPHPETHPTLEAATASLEAATATPTTP